MYSEDYRQEAVAKTKTDSMLWDDVVKGLCIEIAADGCKSYFYSENPYHEKKVALSALNIDEARAEALALHKLNSQKQADSFHQKEAPNLAEVFERCCEVVPVSGFYEQISALQIVFGPTFKALSAIYRHNRESIARVEITEQVKQDLDGYFSHPAFLDACFQVFGTTLYSHDSQKTYLPTGVREFFFEPRSIQYAWSYVELEKEIGLYDTEVLANIFFYDQDGKLLGYAKGFELKLAASGVYLLEQEEESFRTTNHKECWQYQSLHVEDLPRLENTLFVGPNRTQLESFVQSLKMGQHHLFSPETAIETADFDNEISAFFAMLSDVKSAPNIEHIIYLADLPHVESLNAENINMSQRTNMTLLLALLQYATEIAADVPVICVSEGGFHTGVEKIAQSIPLIYSIKALLLSAFREYPSKRFKMLDVDSLKDVQLGDIAPELIDFSDEIIAIRNSERLALRLETIDAYDLEVFQAPYQLKTKEYGALEDLYWQPYQKQLPEKDEIEIAVAAAPINFKDVLHALGMLKTEAGQSGIENDADMLFGGDCAGFVTQVGEQVSEFKVGDKVIATMAFGCLASHVSVNQSLAVKVPESMDLGSASTMTTSFITAYYALISLANIKKGDVVLIHAGTGGLGMAAIQIAQAKGAVVYATAHPSKWPVLRELGVSHIWSSRDLDFSKAIASKSSPGVDVVLNSLSGDFIQQSFNLLRENGRFIEVGKIGILTKEQAKDIRPDVLYEFFDLMDLHQANPFVMNQLLNSVVNLFVDGIIEPLPYKKFSADRVKDAFNWMAQAKHTGKVVVTFPGAGQSLKGCCEDSLCAGRKSILVTGGLGSLGLTVIQSIATENNRIVICGRSNANLSDHKGISSLIKKGCDIVYQSIDITDIDKVKHLFEKERFEEVYHIAGVIEDATIRNQSWQSFHSVGKPKVQGAWNLHHATLSYPVKKFVMFSSIGAWFGSPGQSNYAAANGFEVGLAEYRQSLGLPAMTVSWGPWDDGGMAAELDEMHQKRIQESGLELISHDFGLNALNQLEHSPYTSVLVTPILWEQFAESFPGQMPKYFDGILQAGHIDTKQGLPDDFLSLKPSQQIECLLNIVKETIAKVTRQQDLVSIDEELTLNELGLDSLMGVELKNKLEKSLSIELPASMLMQNPSLLNISEYALDVILGNEGSSLSKAKSSWIVKHSNTSSPQNRIICFHHLGGTAEIYKSWAPFLPEETELIAIQLPFRDSRMQEEAITQFEPLIESLFEELPQLLELPYVVYGHSMGTLVAFEALKEIERRGLSKPYALMVGGLWSPHVHAQQGNKSLPSLSRIDEFEIPQVLLEDSDYLATISKIIEKDTELLRSYVLSDEKKISVPIVAYGGLDDPIANEQDIKSWHLSTSNTFNYHLMSGKHMFILGNEKTITNDAINILKKGMKSC